MKRTNRLLSLTLAAAALTAMASPAQAVETLVITGPSGTFGNDNVVCAGGGTCAFTNTFNFLTPTGFDLANATISSSSLGGNNIDLTSVMLNGTAFTFTSTGVFEMGRLRTISLLAGADNILTVSGLNTGNSAFAGTLTFAAQSAVPEPGTWAMMLLGFGAVGFSMRRKRPSLSLVQAA